MQQAVDETIVYINEISGWTDTARAYSLTSMGVDFHVTQIVDFTKGIHSKIPKSIFKELKDGYWNKTAAVK
jgi:acetamidase/formamidase